MNDQSPVDHLEGPSMSVSPAALKAGRCKAKAHAIRLIQAHVPTLADPATGDSARASAHFGLRYARMLGRQHSFEDDVNNAIETGLDMLRPPSPVAAEMQLIAELCAPACAEPFGQPTLEAAE